MNKQQKIEALQNLISGKLTPAELLNTMPKPMAIVWDDDDTCNVCLLYTSRCV